MPYDLLGNKVKGGSLGFGLYPEKTKKRTLGIRDKQILYHNAKCRCEACNRKIDFSEMETGHKTPASKGGNATLRNSVCLCARCNKLQGTDSWATFMKKLGKEKIDTVTSRKRTATKRRKKHKENYITNIWGQKIKAKDIFNV